MNKMTDAFLWRNMWEFQGLSIYSNLNWMEQSGNAWCQIREEVMCGYEAEHRKLYKIGVVFPSEIGMIAD